jgi:hypothetical protein
MGMLGEVRSGYFLALDTSVEALKLPEGHRILTRAEDGLAVTPFVA